MACNCLGPDEDPNVQYDAPDAPQDVMSQPINPNASPKVHTQLQPSPRVSRSVGGSQLDRVSTCQVLPFLPTMDDIQSQSVGFPSSLSAQMVISLKLYILVNSSRFIFSFLYCRVQISTHR